MLIDPAHPFASCEIFELIAIIGALMVGVHAWGALRRAQPWTEDSEIPLYALLGGLALYLRVTLY